MTKKINNILHPLLQEHRKLTRERRALKEQHTDGQGYVYIETFMGEGLLPLCYDCSHFEAKLRNVANKDTPFPTVYPCSNCIACGSSSTKLYYEEKEVD